jgi:hypothetical protein
MSRLFAVSAILGLMTFAAADDAKDAKLPEKVVVKELQGGFAGLTGKQWTIDVNGKWEEANVFKQKATAVRSGTLGKKEVETLAAELKKYDAATLKDEGKAGTNPKVFSVGYGKNTAELTLKTGADLPAADAKTNQGRFGGVVAAVKAAIPAKK